ncbi:uncharacterized protein DFL_003269 [Arthrobotrys flagrans]|uniref:Nephrocystin 3-like N-terminal domain-containing protein n=1 Tax=Arthrobotrys flagrans TaxID=97331 RepID=A0A437A1D2_ARTFL|nr:hypothetical protein DFL_003269 [Arthrobotrys flagrans]
MLDERHPSLPQDRLDDNAYEFGRIGSYNIIIACLPSGVYGVTSAAIVATQMRRSFPDLIAALMVGIAGGAPEPPQRDIRLGDVVVSEPIAGFGGVLQYDFGKTEQEGRFVQTGVLNKPPKIFLAAIAKLKSDYLLQQNNRSGANSQNNNANIGDIIANSLTNGTVPQEFARPPNDSDRLFQANYDHPSKNASCDQCDSRMIVKRASRPHDRPYIHYGLIASGNQVMKHGITRDCLAREKNVLCFEMEAAGVMDELPSLVIRGICDYSDSHKNKVWQPYAALSAAAFAKELLLRLPFRADERNQPENYVLNLPIAEGAAYRSYADQHKPVGRAGTGKSTISRTLAKNLYTHNRLAASFFFNREEEDRRTSIRFFTTIATQLANHYSCIASKIQKAIQVDPDISTKALKEQFDKLILQPLSGTQLMTHRARLVLVIDALDECEEKESIKIIIYLLGQLKDIKTVDVRVFLTSRPDLPILLTFKKLPDDTYEDIALHEVPRIEHDISLFLQHELCKIREEREELSLPEKWPGEENLEKLVRRAMPLFIYAATLCRFIGDEQWDPDEQIETVLNYRANWHTSQLHMTYLPVLNQLIIGQNPAQKRRLIEEFRQIVGTIINLASLMSASSLARLLSLPERTVNCRLRPLQSVLDIPKNSDNPIRTFHLSFRDFLLDRSLQENNLFWVDESKSHELIAIKCIDLMSDSAGPGLRMNICNLPSLGILRREIDGEVVEKHIPPELRYACRYWVYHLVKSGHRLIDNGQTHQFLLKHLLHWLEATSLLNIKSEALRAVDNLRSIIDVENGAGICGLIHDMKRFVLQNQDIIHKAPLQIYASALIFAPTRSIVRTIFDPKKIVHCTLEGHKRGVNSVAFSPDSKLLASISDDKTVKLWNTATETLLQTLQKYKNWVNNITFSSDGHKNWVNSVAFSPDRKVFALALIDKTVRLWDITTGALLQTLEGYNDSVNSVAFSPDGKLLASASDDKMTLEGYNDSVNSVAFSPDGKLLASASDDKTVRLWDTTTGALLRTLEGHNDSVNSVAFSPDGKLLALVSDDKTVRLWDTATRALLQTLEGLWDTATGALLQTLEGYKDWVNSVAFSPDGKLLASASVGEAVKLWDTATGALLQTLEGHKDWDNDSTFSLNRKDIDTDSEPLYQITLSSKGTKNPNQAETRSYETILVQSEWLVRNGERLIWLPHDYRPSCSAVNGSTIALGHYSGVVSFITFDTSSSSFSLLR